MLKKQNLRDGVKAFMGLFLIFFLTLCFLYGIKKYLHGSADTYLLTNFRALVDALKVALLVVLMYFVFHFLLRLLK